MTTSLSLPVSTMPCSECGRNHAGACRPPCGRCARRHIGRCSAACVVCHSIGHTATSSLCPVKRPPGHLLFLSLLPPRDACLRPPAASRTSAARRQRRRDRTSPLWRAEKSLPHDEYSVSVMQPSGFSSKTHYKQHGSDHSALQIATACHGSKERDRQWRLTRHQAVENRNHLKGKI